MYGTEYGNWKNAQNNSVKNFSEAFRYNCSPEKSLISSHSSQAVQMLPRHLLLLRQTLAFVTALYCIYYFTVKETQIASTFSYHNSYFSIHLVPRFFKSSFLLFVLFTLFVGAFLVGFLSFFWIIKNVGPFSGWVLSLAALHFKQIWWQILFLSICWSSFSKQNKVLLRGMSLHMPERVFLWGVGRSAY